MILCSRVTEYSETNMMYSRNLAIVIWPTLARPEITSFDNMSQNMNMGLFVQTCIENCVTMFGEEIDDVTTMEAN